jgi:hypothetical protein
VLGLQDVLPDGPSIHITSNYKYFSTERVLGGHIKIESQLDRNMCNE